MEKVRLIQIVVDEKCRELLTINKHKGQYSFNKLPLGIKVTPSVFYLLMNTTSILQVQNWTKFS